MSRHVRMLKIQRGLAARWKYFVPTQGFEVSHLINF